MKSVSIIVPIYYGKKYIDGIIRQVEECQNCLDEPASIEILFINDAPDDKILQKPKSRFVDIVIADTDQNVGIHGARVKGLKRCHGEYILFLDQDDRISPQYLQSQFLAIGEYDAVVCNIIHAGRLHYLDHPVFENILSREKMLSESNPIVSPGQVLLKRQSVPDLWSQNLLKHNGADDWFLWLCMIAKNCTFTLNYDVLYEHVITGKNTSEDTISMVQSEQEVVAAIQEKKIFSDHDFKLLLNGFFMKNIIRTRGLHSCKEKLVMLQEWMMQNENGINYAAYLSESGLQSIAIYGCGILGDYLFKELKGDLDVRYFIDQNAEEIHKKIPVYSLQNELPEADGVIITLMEQVDEVKEKLKQKSFTHIFVLKDWLEKHG